MGAINYDKSTPVPAGAGTAKLLDLNSATATPFASTHAQTGAWLQDKCLMAASLDDAPSVTACDGAFQVRVEPTAPWVDVATFSLAEFTKATSRGAGSGWYEQGTPLLVGMPGTEIRVRVDTFTSSPASNVQFWATWPKDR